MKNSNTSPAGRREHIDKSLLQENLRLSPRQRLEQLDQLLQDMDRIRQAVQSQLRNS
jgi:hypothetical protein